MNVYVVTVATENVGYLNILKESCVRYNFTLVVLGFGEKWGGFTWKFLKTREQLDKFDDNDIVIFVDGYDTIILSDKNYIVNNFLTMRTNILVSVEIDDFKTSYISRYVREKKYLGKCRNHKLNSGLYMGYVKYLKQFLDVLCLGKKCDNNSADDQKLMVELCISKDGLDKRDFFGKNVKLDHQLKIFYNCVNSTNNLKKSKSVHMQKDKNGRGLLMNSVSGNRVGIISGPGNTDLSDIIKLYGFEEKYYFRNPYILKINNFIRISKYFYFEILICICLILLIILIVVLLKKKK